MGKRIDRKMGGWSDGGIGVEIDGGMSGMSNKLTGKGWMKEWVGG